MTAIAACRTCGTEPLENARFCHSCGSTVNDGDTRAEYQSLGISWSERETVEPGIVVHVVSDDGGLHPTQFWPHDGA